MARRAWAAGLVALAIATQAVSGVGADERVEHREPQAVTFKLSADAMLGAWETEGAAAPGVWRPGDHVTVSAKLRLTDRHLEAFAVERKARATDAVMLVTAERTFDPDGWLRLPIDERMSTLLTPTGLAIEGGVQGAVTRRFGYTWGTPLDLMASRPLADSPARNGVREVAFALEGDLPRDLPPGIYRLRIDYGLAVGKRLASLAGGGFAQRPSSRDKDAVSYFYTDTIPAAGATAGGRAVDPSRIHRRIPWVLLAQHNSNGYRGVVADEDRRHFALSERNLIADEVVLPRYGGSGERLAYSLEPQFPTDGIDARSNIPWNWERVSSRSRSRDRMGTRWTSARRLSAAERGSGPRPAIPRSCDGSRRLTAATRCRPPDGSRTWRATATRAAAPTASGSPSA